MRCPACTHHLTPVDVNDLTLDVCESGCGGIWFDRFELDRVDEAGESAGESLLNISHDATIAIDHQKRRHCPKCDDTILMRHFFSVKKEVEVDECPRCGGFWLDRGELGRIRGQFENQKDRRAAAQQHFDDLFGPEMEQMRAAGTERQEKAARIARIFRFICPSYYIPGKQKWGAF